MRRPVVYIDGQEGTTGLRIASLLSVRQDMELIRIASDDRRNAQVRSERINHSDLTVLCLPDDAAAEALELVRNPRTRILDTSTARRVHPKWVYGLPEMSAEQRAAIREAHRVANPGCYPVGFILAIRPLIVQGVLDDMAPLTINAVSGYSGGGRKMIKEYSQLKPVGEASDSGRPFCLYALLETHKHVAEMQKFGLTKRAPLFAPAVVHAYQGMIVSVPVPAEYIRATDPVRAVHDVWSNTYAGLPTVRVMEPNNRDSLRTEKFLDLPPAGNCVELFIYGEGEYALMVARLDNLGKGAAGNAIQCLNLMLGFNEYTGLALE